MNPSVVNQLDSLTVTESEVTNVKSCLQITKSAFPCPLDVTKSPKADNPDELWHL